MCAYCFSTATRLRERISVLTLYVHWLPCLLLATDILLKISDFIWQSIFLFILIFKVLKSGERVSSTLKIQFIYSYTGFESKNAYNVTSICMILTLNLFSHSVLHYKRTCAKRQGLCRNTCMRHTHENMAGTKLLHWVVNATIRNGNNTVKIIFYCSPDIFIGYLNVWRAKKHHGWCLATVYL